MAINGHEDLAQLCLLNGIDGVEEKEEEEEEEEERKPLWGGTVCLHYSRKTS